MPPPLFFSSAIFRSFALVLLLRARSFCLAPIALSPSVNCARRVLDDERRHVAAAGFEDAAERRRAVDFDDLGAARSDEQIDARVVEPDGARRRQRDGD